MCSGFTSRGNGDKPFPCVPTQTIYSPYQRIWVAGSASPGLMMGRGWRGKGQQDLKLFKSWIFTDARGSLLIQAVKGKHCQGCDLLTLGAAQLYASLPWEKGMGLSQLGKDFQISFNF